MRKIKKISIFFLICLIYVGLQQLTELATHGFSPQRIQAEDLSFQKAWETPPLSKQEKQHIHATLDQSFHMIGAGSECFAFLSEDGQTVIKFFKLDQFRPVYLYRGLFREDYSAYAHTLFSCPDFLHPWSDRLIGIRAFRLQRTFDSFLIAYEKLKEQTGLIYLHLNPTTEFNKMLTLYDGCGIAHQINLNTTRFILQKKATALLSHLHSLLAERKNQEVKESIDALVALLWDRCQKGISDRDIVSRNFGFVEKKAVEIDVGSFAPMPEMKKRWLYRQEILYATLELKLWLKKEAPDLAAYLEKKVDETIS